MTVMDTVREDIQFVDDARLRQARRQSPSEKMAAGLRLFNQVKRRMASAIRDRYPDANDAEVRDRLRQWLRTARQNENLPWTK